MKQITRSRAVFLNAGLVATLFIGGVWLGQARPDAQRLTAQSIELVDATGKGRVLLTVSNGQLQVSTGDGALEQVVSIGSFSDARRGITIQDADNKEAAFLGLTPASRQVGLEVYSPGGEAKALFAVKNGKAAVLLSGKDALPRSFLATQDDGSVALGLCDAQGVNQCVLDVAPDGASAITLAHAKGVPALQITRTPKGVSGILLFGRGDDKPGAMVQVDQNGVPSIRVLKDGWTRVGLAAGPGDEAGIEFYNRETTLGGIWITDTGAQMTLGDNNGQALFKAP